ncbi:unnamed protein product [Camellia sinensis]
MIACQSNPSKRKKQKHRAAVAAGVVGGFSRFSVLSDLQKAATVAAQEISRNI